MCINGHSVPQIRLCEFFPYNAVNLRLEQGWINLELMGNRSVNRYQRQMLLPQIGEAGQKKLAAARVLLVGCGALGGNIAEQLVRAGVGFLRLVDRDIVELTNLQRQVLFDENHVKTAWPKAAAAAERLGAINSAVEVDAHILDVHAGNIETLAGVDEELPGGPVHLILDGTDNVATRYLINDVAVKHGLPWIYGACVGVEGRVMAVKSSESACLRCVFPTPPRAEELATCDTAGVLGAAAAVVASLQVVAAIKILTAQLDSQADELVSMDVWTNRFHRISLTDAKRADCVCCGLRRFVFLSQPPGESGVTLCGRDAVQIAGNRPIDLDQVMSRWQSAGQVERSRFFLRCKLVEPANVCLTLFPDGRLIVQGTRDAARAKSIYARFVGA